ncbi:MAG: hypothetical protein RMJ66_03130 [Bacteroidia bacterium]|nr:hypothetical protein [Bacteroidia bacterium]MDW8134039.1 hypothetical protein [Bacteroidia bacterium]
MCILLSGCSPSREEGGRAGQAGDSVYVLRWEEVEAYMNAAPSPVQVAVWLRQEKVPFYKEPLHDPTLAGRYSGLKGAANLGIYLTDMAYAHATGHHQEAYDYFSSISRLATLYNIEDILSIERIRQMDKLQDQPDSAQKLFARYYGEIQERLNETGQQLMLRHMILGGWAESLHIILYLVERGNNNQPLSELILLQRSLTPLLVKLYSVDTLHSSVSKQIVYYLQGLQAEFERLPASEPSKTPTTTIKQGVIQMNFKQQVQIAPEHIQAIRAKVEPLRQFFIEV